jgi:hypothetical protein
VPVEHTNLIGIVTRTSWLRRHKGLVQEALDRLAGKAVASLDGSAKRTVEFQIITAQDRLDVCKLDNAHSQMLAGMQATFLNYQLGVIAVMGMGNKVVTEFFELLNQNTVRLTAQEIRNACYQGPFNNLCMELAALPEFRKLIGGGSDLRMESTELVVRVLAYYRLGAEGYAA